MKNLFIIFIFAFLLYGCAKKTYHLASTKVTKQTKSSSDSSGQKKTDIVDKSMIITERNADTAVNTTGRQLTGFINAASDNSTDTAIFSHFENDDVSLDLTTNKKTGQTKAVATPKQKKIIFQVHEKTTVNNDIHKVEADKSKLKTTAEAKSDSTKKKEDKLADPSAAAGSIKTIVIWLLVILAIAAGIFLYVKNKLRV